MGDNNQGQGHGHDEPIDLGRPVDWMVYSHQRLWEMINTGVDLKAAGNAQADWTEVSQALGEVRELLATAINRSAQAWEGGTADRAREALVSVEKWALNTSEHAENVAKCIATEIEHVQTAREMMPPPAPAPPVVTPVGEAAAPPASPLATPTAAPRRLAERGLHGITHETFAPETVERGPAVARTTNPFTGIDTIAAPAVESVTAADATHRQAAEVMAMFQQNSYAVDRTVPSFSPPTNPVAPPPPPVVPLPGGGPSAPPPVQDGGPVVVNNNTTTTPSQQQAADRRAGAGAPAPQFGRGGFAGARGGHGGRGVMPTPVVAGGGGGGGAPAGPGAMSGALGDRGGANPGSVTSQFQAPKSVTPQSGMIGAAPLAAPPPVAAAGGNGERDRNRPGYLEDDDNVFGVDRKAAPPVIGL